MRKILKIAALVLALCLIVGLLWFANAFMGNPVSKYLAERAIKAHLQEHYAGTDLYLERVSYNFKTGGYFGYVVSETSIDTYFTVDTDMLGNVQYDHYESRVLDKYNTLMRLEMEYRELTDTVFESPTFPYESDIAFGTLAYSYGDYGEEDVKRNWYVSMDTLEIDKLYDVRALGAEAGELVLYVQDDNVTPERAAEILLGVKEIFDAAEIPFRGIDFQLEYPKPEDGSQWQEGAVFAYMQYEDIYEEGLLERVQKSNNEIASYYARQDKVKQNEKID